MIKKEMREGAGMTPEQERIYQEIYIKNTKLLYQYIFRKTSNAADTEDLIHEVFIVLLFKLNQFLADYPDNDKLIIAFLIKVANNKLLHYWRKHHDIWDMEISTELLPNLADPRNDFSDIEFTLPSWVTPQDKKLLLLKCEGYSLKEIASQLGISHGACRMRSARLAASLKSFLEK